MDIQSALQQQETIYNDIFKFYSDVQYALEGNEQSLVDLKEKWTGGIFPEEDRLTFEIDSLRQTLTTYETILNSSTQSLLVELGERIQQLEYMHQEITSALQDVQSNEVNPTVPELTNRNNSNITDPQPPNIIQGGRRKHKKTLRKTKKNKRKVKSKH